MKFWVPQYRYGLLLASVLLATSCARKNTLPTSQDYLFRMDNLIPWSIVAFDSQERNPVERIQMIKNLGFRQYAFGGRAKHLATMKEEWRLAQKEGINISAVWLYLNDKKDLPGQLKQ